MRALKCAAACWVIATVFACHGYAGWVSTKQAGFVLQTYTSYQLVTGDNTGTITTNGNSFQFAGDNSGLCWLSGAGAQFRGDNDGEVFIDSVGGCVLGVFGPVAAVTNQGIGSVILGNLAGGQKAVITDVAHASLLLGAGTVSNAQAIVVGDGNASHGSKSVTAGSVWATGLGFFGNAGGLTGLTPAQIAEAGGLTNVTAAQVVAAGGLTNVTAAALVAAGGLTNVTTAAVVAAGGLTNVTQALIGAAGGLTNLTAASIAAGGGLTNVSAAAVVTAGGLTNVTTAAVVDAGGLTNITTAMILAAGGSTNAGTGTVTNETDTLASVLGRGNNGGGLSVTNIGSIDATGTVRIARGGGVRTIDPSATGAGMFGVSVGGMSISTNAFGSVIRGAASGSMLIGPSAVGSEIAGYAVDGGGAEINAIGAMIRGYLNESDNALISAGGSGSILLGEGTITHPNSIVAGVGGLDEPVVSHGEGSITAGGGFYGDGSGLTNIVTTETIAAAGGLTAITIDLIVNAGGLSNVTAAQIVAAGGLTNVMLNGVLFESVNGVATATVQYVVKYQDIVDAGGLTEVTSEMVEDAGALMAPLTAAMIATAGGLTNITRALIGAAGGLTNVTTAQVVDAGGLTNETDTLASVLGRGNNANGQSITNLNQIGANGTIRVGTGIRTNAIHSAAIGAGIFGWDVWSTMTIGSNALGSVIRGIAAGGMVIGPSATGAEIAGYAVDGGDAEINAIGAMIRGFLNDGDHALISAGGAGSILLGEGTITHPNSIVAGVGGLDEPVVSHGEGSITAGGGFWGNMANMTNLTPAQVVAAGGLTNVSTAAVVAAGGLTNNVISPILTPAMLATPAGTGTIDSTSFYWNIGPITSNIVVTIGPSMTNTAQARGFWLDFNRGSNSITFDPVCMTNYMTTVAASNAYSTYWHAGVGQTNFAGNGR
jgi:fibronectin-binding autotransporter adhesin